jgi:hypothetical protein
MDTIGPRGPAAVPAAIPGDVLIVEDDTIIASSSTIRMSPAMAAGTAAGPRGPMGSMVLVQIADI